MLGDVKDCFVYIDDIIVFEKDRKDRDDALLIVIERLLKKGYRSISKD